MVAWSQRVADGTAGVDEVLDRVPQVVRPTVELLPGWDDESVLLDLAWLRQQVLHAFERAAAHRALDEHRTLLRRELGVDVSPELDALVGARPLRTR